jgi:hypothetical protein
VLFASQKASDIARMAMLIADKTCPQILSCPLLAARQRQKKKEE